MEEKVNFRGIVNEYVNIARQEGRNLRNPNFDGVHLHARHFRAPSQAGSSNLLPVSTDQEVTVENGQAGPELKTSKLLENDVEIEILQGYCQDLRDKEMNFDLSHGLGRVKIRVGPGKQKVKASQVEVNMASSSGNGAKATVQTQQSESTESFLTKVYPKGKVMFGEGLGSVNTQHMIEKLKEVGSSSVNRFQKDGDGFYWLMEGYCVMNVGVKHAHNWKSS